jgi:hypothetical protein
LDVDVVEYPSTILEDLQSVNEDVVVPNCLLQREDGAFWGYDKNNWQETPASLEIQKDLSEDFVLLEGKKLAKFCISPPFCVTPHLCGL